MKLPMKVAIFAMALGFIAMLYLCGKGVVTISPRR